MAGEEKVEKSNILMYTTEDGVTKVEVTFDNDTVWLSLDQIADLFQRNKSTISRHIKNIFLEIQLLQILQQLVPTEKDIMWIFIILTLLSLLAIA